MKPDLNAREMMDGYRDGLDADAPAPSENRSHCYRHGFANGRDDLAKKPRSTAEDMRKWAREAERLDFRKW